MPVIALVGRSNVGKSTLFNRLTRTHDALVTNFPGLTRDRKYGRIKWENNECIIIDTGGIDIITEELEKYIIRQSFIAIEEADIVLFIVDGHTGLMASDHNIADYLRKKQKTTIIVVNKIDGIYFNSVAEDFYKLGINCIASISASYGHGIRKLLEQILLLLTKENNLLVRSDYKQDCCNFLLEDVDTYYKKKKKMFNLQTPYVKLAIVGRPNVGKSTLINYILDEERLLVYNQPGTTRDSIYIPVVYDGKKYILIDTAGVRKRSNITEVIEKFSIIKAFRAIDDANVVILLIDAHAGITNQDLSLLNYIINSGRSMVIAINKWDGVSIEVKNNFKYMLNFRLNFIDFSRFHFISALQGNGVNNLFKSVNEAYQCATKRISTALLTRVMHMAIDEYPPPLIHGRSIKPKYAHVGGYNPPVIVIHGVQVKRLSDSYKRYLMGYFRRSLNLMGTPIRIQTNEANNPFITQRNTLISTQYYKQKNNKKHNALKKSK